MILHGDREMLSGRFHYGDVLLWVPGENISGSRAKLFFEQVELHYRDRDTPLVVDLRGISLIDSEGAAALEYSSRKHAGLTVVGRPREFRTLPLAIRAALESLCPASSIEAALSLLHRRHSGQHWQNRRRHCRIPVQIPVEIFSRIGPTAAVLQDLSLGGGRLSSLPPALARYLGEEGNGNGTLAISGVAGDPLGREIAAMYSSPALSSRPVYFLPKNDGVGIKFSGPSPSVS